MDETAREAFDRGTAAGETSARLAGHDQRFTKINGSIDRMVGELHQVVLQLQQLALEAVERDRNVVTVAASVEDKKLATAAALKEAEENRRGLVAGELAANDRRWTPLARALTVIASVVGLLLLAIAGYNSFIK